MTAAWVWAWAEKLARAVASSRRRAEDSRLAAALTQTYVGPVYTNVVMFMILLLMLLIRPNGILGSAFRASR